MVWVFFTAILFAGEKATIKAAREIWLPEDWDPPELTLVNGKFSYTPATPVFAKKNDGIVFTATVNGIVKTVVIRMCRIGKVTFLKDNDGHFIKIVHIL